MSRQRKLKNAKDNYRRRKIKEAEAKWQCYSEAFRKEFEHDPRVVIDEEGTLYCSECLGWLKPWEVDYDTANAARIGKAQVYEHLLWHQEQSKKYDSSENSGDEPEQDDKK